MGVIKHNGLLIFAQQQLNGFSECQEQECSDCTNRVIQHSKQYTVPTLIFTALILQESAIWQKFTIILIRFLLESS